MTRNIILAIILILVTFGVPIGLKYVTDQRDSANPAPENFNPPVVEKANPSKEKTNPPELIETETNAADEIKTPPASSAPTTAAEQLELALEEGQPVWMMLGTTRCPYCVQLKKIFNELKPDYEGKVLFLDVNLDEAENHDLSRKYKVQYVPVTYIYDKNGEVSFFEGGLLDKDLLIEELNKVAE